MVEDHFFDLEGTQGFMWMKGWRCRHCGHAPDPLREANRRLLEATVLVQPPEEPENEHEHGHRRAEPVTRVSA
jgi:glutamate-1-semialdehyde aminotransferase